MLVIVYGLPGTGKSYFSERFAEELHFTYISSDQVRDALGLKGQYEPEEKERVYQTMFLEAGNELQKGKRVLLDATFINQEKLRQARELAAVAQVPCYMIEMLADEETVRQRVNKSRKYSEADYGVYQQLKQQYEAVDTAHLQLNTSQQSLPELIKVAKQYLNHD